MVDPDQFLSDPEYLLTVTANAKEDRWQVVVIEDADEYLAADADLFQGKSLQRLLNLSDGILGQGLRLLLLMTTNVDARQLHPAVARPGRCLASIAFPPFSRLEAKQWITARGADPTFVEHAATLAELYEHLRGSQITAHDAEDLQVAGYA